ncbi:MAG TPA: PASTA domain-containing protein [Streptosporangiaceae bacterium]|nr:PASTA domain-containing protein [Streptosporangiaceae bacterium]
MLAMVVLATVLAVGAGVGYSVARPLLLGDGSAFLERDHTVVRVNGATGEADAESGQVATGSEQVQTVRLPDGRVVAVNKETGAVTVIDGATMASTRRPGAGGGPSTAKGLEPIATKSGGYLVNMGNGTVQELPPPGRAAPPAPVPVRGGIRAAVPAGDSLWVLTEGDELVEMRAGREVRRFGLGEALNGITVADGHPVAVSRLGKAYVVDSDQPHLIGVLGLSGDEVVFGSWRGAGRYVLAADNATHRVAVLDPRTGRVVRPTLDVPYITRLGPPVVLEEYAYVPDYTGSRLWRVNAATGAVDGRLRVPKGDGSGFDLQVSGGHIWANNQYDPYALIVDRDGRDHRADKAPGPEPRGTATAGGPGRPGHGPRPGMPRAPGRSDGPPRRESVSPGQVPSTLGLPHDDACRLINRAGFGCRERTDPTGVTDPDQVGAVASQDPPAGTAKPGTTVTITYPDTFTMPDVRGQSQGEACARLRKYTLRCRPAPGLAAAGAHRPGEVYEQNPGQGTVAREGDTARLLFYGGNGPVGRYVGRNVDEACAQVEADGFQCRPQKGRTAAGTDLQPRTIYQQDPPPGTRQDIKRPVALTFYSDTNTVPDVKGKDRDEACAVLSQAGFACADNHALAANYRIVNDEDGIGGEQPIGTPVNIYWSRWQPVTFSITQGPVHVWTLHQGAGHFTVGAAYPPGADIPGARTVNGFICTSGGDRCRGLDENHLYTLSTDPALGVERPRWRGPTPTAVFMDCALVQGAGARPIYRAWRDFGGWPTSGRGYREEGITSDPTGWEDNELLGCVW